MQGLVLQGQGSGRRLERSQLVAAMSEKHEHGPWFQVFRFLMLLLSCPPERLERTSVNSPLRVMACLQWDYAREIALQIAMDYLEGTGQAPALAFTLEFQPWRTVNYLQRNRRMLNAAY